MADSTIPNLTAVTTPAATDEFGCRQSGDTRDKKQTRVQLHTLQSGEQLLADVGSATAPSYAFNGLPDDGFFSFSDGSIGVTLNGGQQWLFQSTVFAGNRADGPALVFEASTDTNPNIVPDSGDLFTGIGHRIDSIGVLIAKSINVMEFGGVGDVPQLGFYGTAAISKQTGVAVTDAGIHAALVALGLIAA